MGKLNLTGFSLFYENLDPRDMLLREITLYPKLQIFEVLIPILMILQYNVLTFALSILSTSKHMNCYNKL